MLLKYYEFAAVSQPCWVTQKNTSLETWEKNQCATTGLSSNHFSWSQKKKRVFFSWANCVGIKTSPDKPVRKLLEANNNTVRNFKKFDGKNRFFSILLKLSQVVSGDVKMVSECFPILKATPKFLDTSWDHLKKNFQIEFSTIWSQFLSRGYFTLWKWHFMCLFKT